MGTNSGTKDVIFHHTLPLETLPKVGSKIRPVQMVEAFTSEGFNVIDVSGYSTSRKSKMTAIQNDIKDGRKFAFAYSESANSPIALSDRDHFPRHPVADLVFFRCLQRAGVPSGLFYRDAWWRTQAYKESVPLVKRLAAVSCHRFDLLWYKRFFNVLFLPDADMARAIPSKEFKRILALPPGHDASRMRPTGIERTPEKIRLLYVGSLNRSTYNLEILLKAASRTTNAHLTLCIPKSEADLIGSYPSGLLKEVDIVNFSGEALQDLYASADISCLVFGQGFQPYAMPIKLFESIGFGVPIVASFGTTAGKFVLSKEIGWAVGGAAELTSLLEELCDNRLDLKKKTEQVLLEAPSHTWSARARYVATVLSEEHGSRGR